MKRIFLFLLTNLAVMFVLTVSCNVILSFVGPEVRAALVRDGFDYGSLIVFALVFGMGGAFVSLALSKTIARASVGAVTITGDEGSRERWLVETVRELADRAHVGMPEVAIYTGEPNAFATGARRDHALVAVSTGILEEMTPSELKAVLGHEMSHVANGDMVTMTLVQGVLNACVLALSRVIAFAVDNAMGEKKQRRGGSGVYFIVVYLMQFLLGILASLVVCAYSRRREFAADAGSADLLGSPFPMREALMKLGGLESGALPASLKAFGVGGKRGASPFATHPSIEARIAALEKWTPRV